MAPGASRPLAVETATAEEPRRHSSNAGQDDGGGADKKGVVFRYVDRLRQGHRMSRER